MNITFVMGVYNNLEYTKRAYNYLRKYYPTTPLVISSGGSSDGTAEWLKNLKDDNLTYFHDDDRLSLSDTFNTGIKLVDTEKLVIIHNDMVIGKFFLENIEKVLTKDMVLNYTIVEPPIFKNHHKPGKVIKDFGRDFDDFDENAFFGLEKLNKDNPTTELGASFFIAGYKKMFEDVGYFDGFNFYPAFCEDDDFIIRAKLKGYKLMAIYNAMVYHFVSKTSRYSKEMADNSSQYEYNSNLNFIRKWGISPSTFQLLRFWEDREFKYKIFSMGFKSNNEKEIDILEPYFDKIKTNINFSKLIERKEKNTNYNIKSKFTFVEEVDVMVIAENNLEKEDYETISKLRLSIPQYDVGEYIIGNLSINIINEII